MTVLYIIGAVVLILLLAALWVTNFFGMPGNWGIILVCLLWMLIAPHDSTLDYGWEFIAVMVLLAVIGEVIEFAAGAIGSKQAGGSKRSAALALLGSLVGAFSGLFIGIPVPLVGPLVSALFLASLGAMLGAIIGEYWKQQKFDESWKVGKAAFWGRLVGTIGKIAFGAAMLVLAVVFLFV